MMGSCLNVVDSKALRSSVGGSVLWSSPLGPIRFDYAFALSKAKNKTFADGTVGGGDITQAFRFSGGSTF
jgi:outer membrane protein insertion porin family